MSPWQPVESGDSQLVYAGESGEGLGGGDVPNTWVLGKDLTG